MQDDVQPKDESREAADKPTVSNTQWELPLPARRSHRREFQLVAVAVLLLVVLGVVRWHLRAGPSNEPTLPLTGSKETSAKSETATSPPAQLLTDVAVYLTFEPETLESNKLFTMVKDVSGHGHHGILYGAKATQRGKIGSGVLLDGSEACVELPTLRHAHMNSGGPVSVSVWTYETRYHRENSLFSCSPRESDRPVLALARNATNRGYSFRVPWVAAIECSEEYGARQWHHVVGVCSGQTIEVYVDGQRSRGRTSETQRLAKKGEYCDGFGAFLGQGYEGTIDEVLVFRRRLFAEEVSALYQMGLAGRRPAPPVASPSLGAFLAETDEALTYEGANRRERFKEPRLGQLRMQTVDSCRFDYQAYSMACDHDSLLIGNRWGWVSQEYFDARPSVTERVQPLGARLHGLTPSPDDQRVACYGGTGLIYLWDRAKAAPVAHFDTSLEAVASASFSPDGKAIVAGGRIGVNDQEKGAVGLWNSSTFQEIRRFVLPGLDVTAVTMSPDGSRLLAGCLRDKQIHLLDVKTGRLIRTFPANAEEVNCIRFLPDGQRFLYAGDSNPLAFCDAQTGEQIAKLNQHDAKVKYLEVSCNGRYAVSGTTDGWAGIWSLDPIKHSRKATLTYYGGMHSIRHVTFTSDGCGFMYGTNYGAFYRFPIPKSQ